MNNISMVFTGKRLFTHTSEIETKTDLVIQITPKIIKDNYTTYVNYLRECP